MRGRNARLRVGFRRRLLDTMRPTVKREARPGQGQGMGLPLADRDANLRLA